MRDILRKLRCSIVHRNWNYGPIDDWPSSHYQECGTCGRTWARGIRSWYFVNNGGRRVRVEVTSEDIGSGERGDDELCPISYAIRRITGPDKKVSVSMEEIFIWEGSDAYGDCFPTPKPARVFLAAFDEGRPTSPFVFDLPLPQRVCMQL